MRNPYFNNYTSPREQKLVESLVHEALNIFAVDVMYIKRVVLNRDHVIADDKLSKYVAAYPSACFLKNVDGFAGDGTFLSKFGLEVRDQVTLTMSIRTFSEDVIAQDSAFIRPREGDLIWLSLDKKLYEIKFVDQKTMMNQMGAIQAWDLTCEVAEYNNELWSTGYDFLDNIFENVAVNLDENLPTQLLSEDGFAITADDGTPICYGEDDPETDDPLAENSSLESEGQDIIDFSETNPFSDSEKY